MSILSSIKNISVTSKPRFLSLFYQFCGDFDRRSWKMGRKRAKFGRKRHVEALKGIKARWLEISLCASTRGFESLSLRQSKTGRQKAFRFCFAENTNRDSNAVNKTTQWVVLWTVTEDFCETLHKNKSKTLSKNQERIPYAIIKSIYNFCYKSFFACEQQGIRTQWTKQPCELFCERWPKFFCETLH